jgi:hypothetical protein
MRRQRRPRAAPAERRLHESVPSAGVGLLKEVREPDSSDVVTTRLPLGLKAALTARVMWMASGPMVAPRPLPASRTAFPLHSGGIKRRGAHPAAAHTPGHRHTIHRAGALSTEPPRRLSEAKCQETRRGFRRRTCGPQRGVAHACVQVIENSSTCSQLRPVMAFWPRLLARPPRCASAHDIDGPCVY